MPTLAEQLIKSLQALGVKHIFGIPGGPSIPLLDAMRNNGIEFVLVSNEQSAAIMADISGRLTGVPGVCHATFGPGATNLSTGIGGALLDRSPVLALTTEVNERNIGRTVQMNIDHQALFKPLTKWTARLSKENFKNVLANAFNIAGSEIPGPVHIGLPAGVEEEFLSENSLVTHYEKTLLPAPDYSLLTRASKLLIKAKKPLLAVGLTALRQQLKDPIRKFATQNNIPVVLTPMAKGIVPETHPCYTGILFHAKSDAAASIYRDADLVIGIGYDPIEFNYEAWMPNIPLIHIDTAPVDITADYSNICDITGNLADALSFLNALELPAYDWDLEKNQPKQAKNVSGFSPFRTQFQLRRINYNPSGEYARRSYYHGRCRRASPSPGAIMENCRTQPFYHHQRLVSHGFRHPCRYWR